MFLELLQSDRFLLTKSNVCVNALQQIKYPKQPSKQIYPASEEDKVFTEVS